MSIPQTIHGMALVHISSEALDQFAELPRPVKNRLIRLAERLRRWPEVSGAKPLSGALAGKYRMRTGDYRLQFRVEQQTVIIEKVGHRDRFYED